jgi:predicted permease
MPSGASGFLDIFAATFAGVAEIGIVVAIAWIMVARGVIQSSTIKGLSDVTVWVFLPCLHRFREHLSDAVRSLSVKFILIPLLTVLILASTTIAGPIPHLR